MRNQLIAVTLILTALFAISCAAAAPQRAAIAPSQPPSGALPPVPFEAGGDVAAKQADQSGQRSASPVTNAASAERMIVRTFRLGLEVQDTEKSFNDISAIATQYKGYIAQTNLTRDGKNRLVGTVTLRIPAESLDAAMKQIKAAGLKVLNENSNANDVTDQYTDLSARQKNLEATEVELQKLLATVRERTGKAEDILAVYNRLTEIRQQIEQIKGQINVINRTTALATVTIQLTPHEEIQVLEPDTWLPNRTAAQALRALIRTLQGLADLTIWLILLVLPLLIVLAIPFVAFAYILRVIMRRRATNKPVSGS